MKGRAPEAAPTQRAQIFLARVAPHDDATFRHGEHRQHQSGGATPRNAEEQLGRLRDRYAVAAGAHEGRHDGSVPQECELPVRCVVERDGDARESRRRGR